MLHQADTFIVRRIYDAADRILLHSQLTSIRKAEPSHKPSLPNTTVLAVWAETFSLCADVSSPHSGNAHLPQIVLSL
jgi:hypothetical protein